MHGTPIRWAYYCIFRAANAPDLGLTVLLFVEVRKQKDKQRKNGKPYPSFVPLHGQLLAMVKEHGADTSSCSPQYRKSLCESWGRSPGIYRSPSWAGPAPRVPPSSLRDCFFESLIGLGMAHLGREISEVSYPGSQQRGTTVFGKLSTPEGNQGQFVVKSKSPLFY
jgi:hypothetical protein